MSQVDVAWKIGSGSTVDDWELRMSLRSFSKNYRSNGNYWIIGHIPNWLDQSKIKCLPWPDPYPNCKDANLIHKALRLAAEPSISKQFIFCSDDQLLLRPLAASEFHPWNCGQIPHAANDKMNKWQKRLVNTGEKLRSQGFTSFNFEGHIPYLLDKEWIWNALRFDFATRPGMCVHSTIMNCGGLVSESLFGKNVRTWLGECDISAKDLKERLDRCCFASLNSDSVKSGTLLTELSMRFPEPAPWEMSPSSSP